MFGAVQGDSLMMGKMAPEAAFDAEAFAAGLSPFSQSVFAYWNGKRGSRPMPARRDLDPLEMRGFLPQVMLLDVLDGGRDFFCRVVGSDIRERIGFEMTGRLLSELNGEPAVVEAILEEYREVVRLRRPTSARHDFVNRVTGRPKVYERLTMPLSDDGTAVNMLFGVRRDLLEQQLAGAPLQAGA
jgi:hypothetical protein